MCVIYLSFRADAAWRLVVAANRDEFHERPTAALHAWNDEDGILAGRDLRGGGTWMGVHRDGRFAALTNFREPAAVPGPAPSRGGLVTEYLREGGDPASWLERVAARADAYAGFSLFASDLETLAHFSNRSGSVRTLPPGRYAISNGLLGDPWPKVVRGLAAFERALGETSVGAPSRRAPRQNVTSAREGSRRDAAATWEALTDTFLDVLRDATPAGDGDLPDTGVGPDREKMLSPIFIRGSEYGTRSSSVILVGEGGEGEFVEESFGPDAVPAGRAAERFRAAAGPGPDGSSSRGSR
ncbi:MAG: NRDE family protein [Thermoanaerobaculia bacterium]